MPSVRIWTLESDYDAKAVRSLAEKLAVHLHLEQLSIQISGKGALPKRRGLTQHEMLRKAVQNYLKQDDCVIFVIETAMGRCQTASAATSRIHSSIRSCGSSMIVLLMEEFTLPPQCTNSNHGF